VDAAITRNIARVRFIPRRGEARPRTHAGYQEFPKQLPSTQPAAHETHYLPSLPLALNERGFAGTGRINPNTRDAFLRDAVWEPLHNAEAASFLTAIREKKKNKKMWHLPSARSLARSCRNCNLLFRPTRARSLAFRFSCYPSRATGLPPPPPAPLSFFSSLSRLTWSSLVDASGTCCRINRDFVDSVDIRGRTPRQLTNKKTKRNRTIVSS